MVSAGGVQLHDGDSHLLPQNEGCPNADVLVHSVGGHLGNNVHKGGLENVESLDPLFTIPGVFDSLLLPVSAGGTGPEPELDGLEVVPEHPSIHGVLCGLILVDLT